MRRLAGISTSIAAAAWLTTLLLPTHSAFGQSLNRPVDEIVVRGSALPEFLTNPPIPLDQLHLYRWDGAAFEPIPFQIDEVKTWDLFSNTTATCGTAAAPPGVTSQCETNYAFDFANYGGVGTDEWPGLDGNDELVFMARDAGPPPDSTWLDGTHDTRYEIKVADERLDTNGNIITEGTGWVFLFRFVSGQAPAYGPKHYVEWEPKGSDPDPDRAEACSSAAGEGDPVVARRIKACGWARGNASSLTGQSAEPTLDVRFAGNWILNRLRFRAAGNTGTPSGDLLDRLKYRTAQESEDTWCSAGCPLFKGLKAYDGDTFASPIRVLRLVQGTQSGAFTTRNDTFYGTHFRTRVRLRVHYGVPELRYFIDFLRVATPINLYTVLYPPPGTAADVINGRGTDNDPPGTYEPGPTTFNWTQFDTSADGRVVTFIRESRPFLFSQGAEFYYNDVAANDSKEPPEYEDKSYGNTGVKWKGSSIDMQDLICNANPDDPLGLWRELEVVTFAASSDRNAVAYLDWLKRPLQVYPVARHRTSVPTPPPMPCKPSLGVNNPGSGFSLSLALSAPCASVEGFDVFRAIGSGAFGFFTRVPSGAGVVDPSVRDGVTYRYEAFAFNSAGQHGPGSDQASVTVLDLQPPAAPQGLAVAPLVQGARIDWEHPASFDVVGYDVYMGTVADGPYEKINAQPLSVTTRTYTAVGLDPNTLYYVVIRAIDAAGNESANSVEVSVVPLP